MIRNRPQQISALTVHQEYELGRPQSPFTVQPPLPPGFDDELIEEVAGVFDNMIYDADGVGDTGKVLIATSASQSTSLIAVEESTGVFDQLVHEESTGVIGNMVERGG